MKKKEDKTSKASLLEAALKEFDPVRPKMNAQEMAVLERVAASLKAAKAFASFNVDPKTGGFILLACIEADQLARTFDSRIRVEKRLLGNDGKHGDLDRLDEAVEALRGFFQEMCEVGSDGLSAKITYSEEDVGAVKRGIYLLKDAIRARREVAEQTLLRLGSTRKTKDRGRAAKTAAIGWFAEAIERRCGRPHLRAAADLAEVVLKCEISLDRMREARRTRDRPWY